VVATDETYNGWTNRETWALHLWLTNEEPWYRMIQRWGNMYLPEDKDEIGVYEADKIKGEVEEWYNDILERGGEGAINVAADIGSIWRVDWQELAEAIWECTYDQ